MKFYLNLNDNNIKSIFHYNTLRSIIRRLFKSLKQIFVEYEEFYIITIIYNTILYISSLKFKPLTK